MLDLPDCHKNDELYKILADAPVNSFNNQTLQMLIESQWHKVSRLKYILILPSLL